MESDDAPVAVDRSLMEVPAEMIMEIAAGMEEPFAVAYRYGYSYDSFTALSKWPSFNVAVENKKAELKASGHTFRLMTGWMAEDLAKKLYVQAKSNDATLPQVHEVFKTMSRLADYEPKQAAPNPQAAGAGFSVNIIMAPAQPKQVIDISVEPKLVGEESTLSSTSHAD